MSFVQSRKLIIIFCFFLNLLYTTLINFFTNFITQVSQAFMSDFPGKLQLFTASSYRAFHNVFRILLMEIREKNA